MSGRLSGSGRGLALVDAVSVTWGATVNGDGGKTVWARLPLKFTAAPPARRVPAVPAQFSTEYAVLERVLRRMRALWSGPPSAAPG
jgi:hypothetical protein